MKQPESSPDGVRIRNAAKAIIIRDGRLLVTVNHDRHGRWYLLPGGGQRPHESLHDTLQRECEEEIGTRVTIGPLRLVRDYIGRNHQFADEDCKFHQVEMMFQCSVPADYQPRMGAEHDKKQVGVEWLDVSRLHDAPIFPSTLSDVLRKPLDCSCDVYLGDVN